MTGKRQYNSLLTDSISSVVASAMVVVMGCVFMGVLSRWMGRDEFGEFLYARRLIVFLFPLTSLSVGTGLTQAVARIGDGKLARRMLWWTHLFTAASGACLVCLAFCLPRSVTSFLLLESSSTRMLWTASALYLAGYGFFVVSYSYQRGLLRIGTANLVNLLANGVLPLIVVGALHATGNLTAVNALICMGVVYACFLAFSLGPALRGAAGATSALKRAADEFRVYLIPRMPAGLLAATVPYVIPWFLRDDLPLVAAFLAGMLLLQAIHAFTDSIGVVLFPVSAHWHEDGKTDDISRILTAIFSFSTQFGLVVTVQMAVWADVIVALWFGKGYEQAATAARWLSLSIIPALLFYTTKSVLDGVERKALTTVSLAIGAGSVIVFCATCELFASRLNIAAAGVAMFIGLASSVAYNLSALSSKISFGKDWPRLAEALVLALALGAASLLLSRTCVSGSVGSSSALAVSCVLTALSVYAWARLRKPSWLPGSR